MNNKKVGSTLATILTYLLLILSVGIFAYSFLQRRENKQITFFGYSFYVVVTNSMTPEILVGDLIVCKEVPFESVEVGQNVVFLWQGQEEGIYGMPVVHRCVGRSDTEIRTKGVRTGTVEDKIPVTKDNFLGRQIYKSTFLGSVVTTFSNPATWIFVAGLTVSYVIGTRALRDIMLKERTLFKTLDD